MKSSFAVLVEDERASLGNETPAAWRCGVSLDARRRRTLNAATTCFCAHSTFTMFGDVFGTRSDYTRGLMYASRRQYLVGPGRNQPKKLSHVPGRQFRRQCREEILKPPQEFLTRKQARRSNAAKSPAKNNVKQLGFASK